ncbi:biopolymer transporter ExbD, partial [Klebsiella pneumoniae]
PLLTVGVQVDLPKTGAQAVQGNDEPITVSVDAQGRIFIQETAVDPTDLVPRLSAIAKGAADRRIFVRGDQAINYGRVMEVMGMINAAGFSRVAL